MLMSKYPALLNVRAHAQLQDGSGGGHLAAEAQLAPAYGTCSTEYVIVRTGLLRCARPLSDAGFKFKRISQP
jgi:hypothetical protein